MTSSMGGRPSSVAGVAGVLSLIVGVLKLRDFRVRLLGDNEAEETLASTGAKIGEAISNKDNDFFICIGKISSESFVTWSSNSGCRIFFGLGFDVTDDMLAIRLELLDPCRISLVSFDGVTFNGIPTALSE